MVSQAITLHAFANKVVRLWKLMKFIFIIGKSRGRQTYTIVLSNPKLHQKKMYDER